MVFYLSELFPAICPNHMDSLFVCPTVKILPLLVLILPLTIRSNVVSRISRPCCLLPTPNRGCPSIRSFVLNLFGFLHIIISSRVSNYLGTIRLSHPLLFLLSFLIEVHLIFHNIRLVVDLWALPTTPIGYSRIRELFFQIALGGRAFPLAIDASGLDTMVSPTFIPRLCKIYLFSPSL